MPTLKEQQFRELFHSEYEKMCRYAFSYLKDEHTAEDVVQETFVKLWEQKQDLMGLENIRFYLITSIRNNSISFLRKQKKLSIDTDKLPEPDPEIGTIRSIEAETRAELALKIQQALNQLPPKCKEVFLLVKMHGMSYKQCAELLGLSIKTIENQMSKAIKILRISRPALLLLLSLF